MSPKKRENAFKGNEELQDENTMIRKPISSDTEWYIVRSTTDDVYVHGFVYKVIDKTESPR